MIVSEIGLIVSFYFKTFKRSYSNFLGKGVMGKRLAQLLSETDEINPDNLISFENLGVRNKDGSPNIPETYEEWRRKDDEKSINNLSQSAALMGCFGPSYKTS